MSYMAIKHLHIFLVLVSVTFFTFRGMAALLEFKWLKSTWAKVLPHLIDTVLLISGITLAYKSGQYPFVQAWLTVKVLLLAAYIIFGIKTMKATSKFSQMLFYIAALSCVALLISVAISHNPLGLLARWL